MIVKEPLVWNVVEDMEFYNDIEDKELDVLLLPSEGEVRKRLKKDAQFYVVAPFYPPDSLSSVFVTHRIKNKHGALTIQEINYIESIAKKEDRKKIKRAIIEKKLRLKIHAPELTLYDLKGMFALKKEIKKIVATIDKPLLRARGVFLVGIPGTGKSYSCKCVAGELNRWLIEMNLSRILEDERPIELLFRIFEFLETFTEPSILWIDEIDKVFTGGEKETKMMGQLLTIINEFNTDTGYKADSFFWVTANNITEIARKNPEFFRRFDYLFFVQTPYLEEVYDIFKMYFKKYSVYPRLSDKERPLDEEIKDIIVLVDSIYRDFIDERDTASDASGVRFLYTPAEIETIVKKCAIICAAENKNTFNIKDLTEVLNLVRPVRQSMQKAIDEMLAQKHMFVTV